MNNCQVETEECCLKCGASNGQGSGLSNIDCEGKHIIGYCHTHKQQHKECHKGFREYRCCKSIPMIGIKLNEDEQTNTQG